MMVVVVVVVVVEDEDESEEGISRRPSLLFRASHCWGEAGRLRHSAELRMKIRSMVLVAKVSAARMAEKRVEAVPRERLRAKGVEVLDDGARDLV